MTEIWQKLVLLQIKCSVFEKNIQLTYYQNRMTNIHIHIESEYGKENFQTFRHWEKLEYKMADFETTTDFLSDALVRTLNL